jgi:putative membrane protein
VFFTKVATSVSGLAGFISYFATSIVLLFFFAKIYERVTPYREFDLIRQGNTAAACSFGGALLGFAVPLASAIAHSAGFLDMIIWGIIALAVQILAFYAVQKIFPGIVADIPANEVSKGAFLGIVSLAAGILNAACMT